MSEDKCQMSELAFDIWKMASVEQKVVEEFDSDNAQAGI
jgi:hypothetical protein